MTGTCDPAPVYRRLATYRSSYGPWRFLILLRSCFTAARYLFVILYPQDFAGTATGRIQKQAPGAAKKVNKPVPVAPTVHKLAPTPTSGARSPAEIRQNAASKYKEVLEEVAKDAKSKDDAANAELGDPAELAEQIETEAHTAYGVPPPPPPASMYLAIGTAVSSFCPVFRTVCGVGHSYTVNTRAQEPPQLWLLCKNPTHRVHACDQLQCTPSHGHPVRVAGAALFPGVIPITCACAPRWPEPSMQAGTCILATYRML